MSFNYNLLLALYLLIIAMTLVLLAVWQFNKEIKGLREWFFGYLAALINMTFFILNPSVSELTFVLINQSTLMATGYFSLKGCCRLVNTRSPVEKIAMPIILITLGVSSYFTVVENNLAIRFFIASFVSGFFCMAGSIYLLRQGFKLLHFQFLFGITLFIHGVFNAVRSALFTHRAEVWIKSISIAPTDVILCEQILITSLLALGVLMMTNEFISKELRNHAEQDSLTNLFNRRFFLKLLHKSKSLAIRTNNPLYLLVLDIDHFKSINDKFGHLAGDEVLIHFAKTAQKTLRAEDVMGRIGGEEFAIFLPNTDGDSAVIFAERLRKTIEDEVALTSKGNVQYTVSIGVKVVGNEASIENVLDEADLAMYEAKRKGRNRVEYNSAHF